MPNEATVVRTLTTMLAFLRSSGSVSAVAWSHQSTSPACNAAVAVAGSGIVCHSTPSKCASFGPARKLGVPVAPRHVVGEFRVHVQRTLHALARNVAIGTAADDLWHAVGRLGLG